MEVADKVYYVCAECGREREIKIPRGKTISAADLKCDNGCRTSIFYKKRTPCHEAVEAR